MAVIDVGEADFEQRVIQASHQAPVVVDFWAGWCRPCLVLSPILERLAEENEGRFTLAKVDVDANQALAATFRVQGIPAVKAFRDGRVVSEFVGAQPEDVVRRFLEPLLPSEADDEAEAGRTAEEAGDPARAETHYRRALELDPAHPLAAVGLSRMLVESEPDRARELLARVAPSAESRALQARLALEEAAEAAQPGLREVAAAAASGDHRRALELGMDLVANGDREGARELVVRIFETLGDDHPLTREFRPRLARALF